jgi:hypothetical protein
MALAGVWGRGEKLHEAAELWLVGDPMISAGAYVHSKQEDAYPMSRPKQSTSYGACTYVHCAVLCCTVLHCLHAYAHTHAPSRSRSMRSFFSATTSPVVRSRALYTTPKVPSPIRLIFSAAGGASLRRRDNSDQPWSPCYDVHTLRLERTIVCHVLLWVHRKLVIRQVDVFCHA